MVIRMSENVSEPSVLTSIKDGLGRWAMSTLSDWSRSWRPATGSSRRATGSLEATTMWSAGGLGMTEKAIAFPFVGLIVTPVKVLLKRLLMIYLHRVALLVKGIL